MNIGSKGLVSVFLGAALTVGCGYSDPKKHDCSNDNGRSVVTVSNLSGLKTTFIFKTASTNPQTKEPAQVHQVFETSLMSSAEKAVTIAGFCNTGEIDFGHFQKKPGFSARDANPVRI